MFGALDEGVFCGASGRGGDRVEEPADGEGEGEGVRGAAPRAAVAGVCGKAPDRGRGVELMACLAFAGWRCVAVLEQREIN